MQGLTDVKGALRWFNELRLDLLKSRILGYLLMLSIAATLMVGLLLFLVDPNIKTPLDGIWSAWVTMTHVGFGDVVPVSFWGRLLSSGLILLGFILFSLFTAQVSVTLIGKTLNNLDGDVRAIERDSAFILSEEDRILEELARLRLRMEMLQQEKDETEINSCHGADRA